MKSLFKKRIVDERMELQSLRNARKSWNFLLLATGFCLLAELHLLRWELKYIVPQAVVVLAASVYNLFLDARDGNIYTAENANRKKLFLLYAISSRQQSSLSFFYSFSCLGLCIWWILFASVSGKKERSGTTKRKKSNPAYRRRRQTPSPSIS